MPETHTHSRRNAHRYRPERRSAHRFLCSDLVRVRWTPNRGQRREEVAILEDLSTTGANLFMGVWVDEGSRVTLTKGQKEFRGVVRYCLMERNGYFVGIEFEEGSRWKGHAEYRPDHLLDVTRLTFPPKPEE